MNAIKLLESQHDEVDTLFAQLETAQSRELRLDVFHRLADVLIAHAAIEERLFYPAVFAGDLKDRLVEAVEDHHRVKLLLADLFELEPTDPRFDLKLKVLQEEVETHVGEEEDVLFPLVQDTLRKFELDSLGDAMEDMYDDVRDGSKKEDDGLPDFTPDLSLPYQ